MALRLSDKFSSALIYWRIWIIACVHALLTIGSLTVAWLLLFDFTLPHRRLLLGSAVLLVAMRLFAIRLCNLHRGWWHYTGVADAIDILRAVTLGSVLFVMAEWVLHLIDLFPKPVLILEPFLTAGLIACARLVSRVTAESVRKDLASSKRALIVGAGFAAQQLIREFQQPNSEYVIVGCVDDDHSKLGIRIQGVPVLGIVDNLPGLVIEYYVDEVLIVIPSASGAQMTRFIEVCNSAKVKFRTVPALKDVIAGQVSISQLREVSLEDLLGRDPVLIDLESVRRLIVGRTVAVTGAAGSIGSELCRQILEYMPACLICMDQSETGLFFLQADLSSRTNGSNLAVCVVDICDGERMRYLLREFKPEVIFHAAAYKHVPLMEQNPHEAVKNNVFALQQLLNIAGETGCKHFVLISSDKAVNPISIMGATKRLGELIVASRPANGMQCVSVRFGNVLGSNGSVVPVFQQQLQDNRPLTITHPEVKRFFMTTREAVALVLQAFAIGNHGDILVLEMGKPISIVDLARNLIRLSGRAEEKIAFEFTGLRPGEKLEEELFYPSEEVSSTSCPKIKKALALLESWPELCHQLDELRLAVNMNGAMSIAAQIKQIVPEFQSSLSKQRLPVNEEINSSRTSSILELNAPLHKAAP